MLNPSSLTTHILCKFDALITYMSQMKHKNIIYKLPYSAPASAQDPRKLDKYLKQ
jgi:hypothetical protein